MKNINIIFLIILLSLLNIDGCKKNDSMVDLSDSHNITGNSTTTNLDTTQLTSSQALTLWRSNNIHSYSCEQNNYHWSTGYVHVKVVVKSDTLYSSVPIDSVGNKITYAVTVEQLFNLIQDTSYFGITCTFDNKYGYPTTLYARPKSKYVYPQSTSEYSISDFKKE
jgi:hypothetical protein